MTGTHDATATAKVRRYQFCTPETKAPRFVGTLWEDSPLDPWLGSVPVTLIPDAAYDALYDKLVTAFAGRADRWDLAALALEVIGVREPSRVVAEFKWREETAFTFNAKADTSCDEVHTTTTTERAA